MNLSRRKFLGGASASGFSAWYGNKLATALDQKTPSGRFKRCVVLWMEGGPSQLDTFDPKEPQMGSRRSVATRIPGLRFSETLSQLADRADQLCVLRSVGSREGEHARATELMHTGFAPLPSFPRPSLGSLVSSDRADPGFPRYVTLGGNGFGPAYLGSEHGPFVIEDINTAKNQLGRIQRKRRSLELLRQINFSYAGGTTSRAVDQRTAAVESVHQLLSTGFAESLDLDATRPRDRQRYGDHEFGQRVLTARRLLELGVPLVEVQLGGWDSHIDNERQTATLCQALQKPWLALVDDLQSSGSWDDTLVVWTGEFGRTPRLNGRAGRDHFPEVIPVVLSGGNLGGRVVGATSDDGMQRVGPRHSVADLMATLLTLLGLDVDAEYTTDFGSPTTATDGGTPIKEIVG